MCANYWLFWLGCLLLIVFCVEQWASFLLVFWFLAFGTGVKKLWLICPEVTLCRWRDIQIQELNNFNMCNGPVLIWWRKYVSIYISTDSAWESHIVPLYEWLQNFETKEPTRREWCKLLKKARTANPSATTVHVPALTQRYFHRLPIQTLPNLSADGSDTVRLVRYDIFVYYGGFR